MWISLDFYKKSLVLASLYCQKTVVLVSHGVIRSFVCKYARTQTHTHTHAHSPFLSTDGLPNYVDPKSASDDGRRIIIDSDGVCAFSFCIMGMYLHTHVF